MNSEKVKIFVLKPKPINKFITVPDFLMAAFLKPKGIRLHAIKKYGEKRYSYIFYNSRRLRYLIGKFSSNDGGFIDAFSDPYGEIHIALNNLRCLIYRFSNNG